MLSYLKAEADFLRAYGNRSLLLVFLCALTRTADPVGKGSFLGVSLDLNQGEIIVIGPILALLVLVSLRLEADNLALARPAALQDAKGAASLGRPTAWTYALFCVPALTAAFMLVQFLTDLAPATVGCGGFAWTRHFLDLSLTPGPAVFCIRDLTKDMPWIYPPYQAYAYLVCLAVCLQLTYRICAAWSADRERVTADPGFVT